jgi:hypothetical protein
MLKITKRDINEAASICMYELKPMEIAVIIEACSYKGDYVMRSQSVDAGEVINLSNPIPGMNWGLDSSLLVRKLAPEEQLTITLSNAPQLDED